MKRFVRNLLIIATICSTFALERAEAEPALPIYISNGSDQIDDALANDLREIIDSALSLVKEFAPKGYENNLFQWTGDRARLSGKSIKIVLATSKTPLVAPLLARSGADELDAFTMAPVSSDKKSMPIMLVLIVDRIFYDDDLRERKDGVARLVIALAHEIYGNVQNFLEMDLSKVKPQTVGDRVYQERRSYRASIMFLGGLISDSRFAQVPPDTRNGILNRLPREIEAYRSWWSAHPSEKLDPAAESMLQALKRSAEKAN